MDFPHPFEPDPTTRAGRMMMAGRVKVTVKDMATNDHITVLFKCIADNRNRQYSQVDNSKWVECSLADCTHLFTEIPSQGHWNDKVGTYYPKTGRWYDADNADPVRVIAAKLIGHWLCDPDLQSQGYTFQEANECGVCGRELTDPESIARGIGPTCLGKMTGSHHQVKDLDVEREARGTQRFDFTDPGEVVVSTISLKEMSTESILQLMSDCTKELKSRFQRPPLKLDENEADAITSMPDSDFMGR